MNHPDIKETFLTTRTSSGTLVRSKAVLEFSEGRILFLKSPFSLKDEIKAMKGSKWHGHDESDGRKIWSVEDCPRNRFQLSFLEGEDVYKWFDQDIVKHDYSGTMLEGKIVEVMPHQCDLADSGLTFHYQLWAAEMGVGKTLAAQLVIERSGVKRWWWVGPKTSIPNIKREFRKWHFDFEEIQVEFITYEELTDRVDNWKPTDILPQGVILDESSRLKGPTSQRTRASQRLADWMREKYGFDAYVIEMSGTPSPKSPLDWWSQCEIAWPGFLREGSTKALEQRLAFIVPQQYPTGVFPKRIGWKDDERKCKQCGGLEDASLHFCELCNNPEEYHKYQKSFNEVAYMYERLQGLVQIKHKKDCLNLPDKRYRKILCNPNPSTLRLAKALGETADSAIVGLTLLRELSDGFQYRDIPDGKKPCDHCEEASGFVKEWYDPEHEGRTFRAIEMLDEKLVSRLLQREVQCPRCRGTKEVDKLIRISKEVPCPKDKALLGLLDECEETGRIVIFAGFTGSVDRVTELCRKNGWAVVRCDGRGFEVSIREKNETKVVCTGGEAALDYWADTELNPRVAFVAHPESGGMSLTLVEARMAVYWSNSFKPEYRAQSEDRIHRKGMDENLGCEIVDLIHLPTDEKVLGVIQANRKLELMTMGEFLPDLNDALVIEEIAA